MQTSHYHIFSLPPELLESLTPRNLINKIPSQPPTPTPELTSKTGPRACAICKGIVFLDVNEQRTHFRSDWHRYNVKIRMNGGQTVTEAAFNQLIEGLEDSLSGSESSEDDEGEDSDAVNTLLSKTKQLNTRSSSPEQISSNAPVTALTWFHSPPKTQIGIYRVILPLKIDPTSYFEELRKLQVKKPNGRTWAIFMVAGGHFAGAVVRVSPEEEVEEGNAQGRKKKQKKPKPDVEVILHKTFHRYTTRRKQGGSQSANDNAKGPAKSAGALLRRYGEQALRDDIRSLLDEWREDITDCERIWIRANISNRKIFYDYDEAPFTKNDDRLRTFPFPTRRPTQSELTRCLKELIHPKISHFTEEELRVQDEAYLASLPKPKPAPTPIIQQPIPEKPKQPKLSKEEEGFREKWSRLLEMVHKNRLEPLKSFWEREQSAFGSIDIHIPDWAVEKRATILQIAVDHGHEDMVQWLLEEVRADPTIPVPFLKAGEVGNNSEDNQSDAGGPITGSSPRRAAYDLTKTKSMRDIFRRCAAAHPEWWDWFGAAHIPSALSQEMEEEREEKKKARRKGLKDRAREREAKEKVKEKDQLKTPEPVVEVKPVREVASNVGARRLGGASGAVDGVVGLTPEMRAKVERERRARAAEARLKALGTN